MSKFYTRGLFACLSLISLGSCQDFDGGFDSDTIKKESYAKDFEKTFGKPDPNQDWSMASTVQAKVTASIGVNGQIQIYSDNPIFANSKLLGLAKSGETLDFNAIKGTEQIFAVVRENGKTTALGYYNIIDNKVDIDNSPVAKKVISSNLTRAASDVTQGTQLTIFSNAVSSVQKYKWKSTLSASDVKYYTLEELRAWGALTATENPGSYNQYSHQPFNDDCVVAAGYDWNKATINENKVIAFTKEGYHCSLQGQWGQSLESYGVYTFAELVSVVNERNNVNNVWPFKSGTVTANDGVLDFSNAEIDPACQFVHVGDYHYIHNGGHVYFTSLTAMQDFTSTNNLYNNGPFNTCYFDTHLDFTNATINTAQAPLEYTQDQAVTLTYLNNVETWSAEPWNLELGKSLFGPGTFFMERGLYYSDAAKLKLYGETDEEKKATIEKIEAGFSIVSSGGEIEIPFIYGATKIPDQFGYVYYKADKEGIIDPLAQPHFVLMNNGCPQNNIYFDSWGGTAVGNMQLSGWNDGSADPTWAFSDGTLLSKDVYGTKYKLAFFGENYDETATYTFPSGYKIIFFVCPGNGEGIAVNSNGTLGDGTTASYRLGDFNYSLPELNKRIGHYYANTTSPTYKTGDNMNRGAVKAVAWTTNGMTFMGFEDGGNDEDLNDIVFWVEGSFTPEQDLVEVEVTTSKKENSWIFACEDLGGTFDYDFNDVVWEVAQPYEETYEDGILTNTTYGNIEIRLLAAGGTLPVNLVYNEEDLGEVHQQLGGVSPANIYSPINITAPKATLSAKVVKTIETTSAMNINTLKGSFKLKVKGTDGQAYYVTTPDANEHNSGNAKPQIILLPATWEWPIENKCIKDAYPDFTNWANNATANDWLSKKTTNAWYVKKK